MQNLAAYPDKFHIFLSTKGPSILLSIMNHENLDIIMDVISILAEFTEVEFMLENEKNMKFLDHLMSTQSIHLAINHLADLNPAKQSDASSIHKILTLIENMSDLRPSICNSLITDTNLANSLISIINVKFVIENNLSHNELYASEVLSIIVQNSEKARKCFGKSGLLEVLIQRPKTLSKTERTLGREEFEYLGNISNAICSIMMIPETRNLFRRLEGIETFLMMVG